MGATFSCKFCGDYVTLNQYSASGGYCEACRCPVKLREKLAKANNETIELSHKLQAEELKSSCLTSELKKYKKSEPCPTCHGAGEVERHLPSCCCAFCQSPYNPAPRW